MQFSGVTICLGLLFFVIGCENKIQESRTTQLSENPKPGTQKKDRIPSKNKATRKLQFNTEKATLFGIYTERTNAAESLEFVNNSTPPYKLGKKATLYFWYNIGWWNRRVVPREGEQCWALKSVANKGFGTGVCLGLSRNLSKYKNGALHFSIKSTSKVKLKVGIKSNDDREVWLPLGNEQDEFGFARNSEWHHIQVPLSEFSSVDFSKVIQPFMIKATKQNGSTEFAIDDIYWNSVKKKNN